MPGVMLINKESGSALLLHSGDVGNKKKPPIAIELQWAGFGRFVYRSQKKNQTLRSNGLAGAGSVSRALRAASIAALLSASGATHTFKSVSNSSANLTFTV